MLHSFPRTSRARLALVVALLSGGPLAAVSAEGVGWRTDGTGNYPKARPPLEWSPTKNVLWRTPMPGYGVSHPVPLGNRIFICSEPCTLLCLDRADGKVLWQKTSSYSELEVPPEVQAQLKVELAETAVLEKKKQAVRKEMDLIHRPLAKEVEGKLKPFRKRIDELEKEKKKLPAETAALEEKKQAVRKEMDLLHRSLNKEVEEKLKPFRKRIDELEKEKKKLTVAVRYTQPPTHPTAGYSAPTPVTDGKEVFAAFGNGLVACFDLDGNRKWLKLIEHSNAAFAHSGSPVLAGDKVLIHYTDLVALDRKTGDEVWRLKHPTSHGTPLVTRIGDVDVVLTPKGAMVRADDGKVLADKLGSCGANSPVLHDGIVYCVHGPANAVRLPDSVPGPVKLKPLWKGKVQGGGYWFSSPVVHGGLLYAANDQGILTVLDAATGARVYDRRLNLRGSVYPSISAAGDRVYVSSDTGTTVVLQAGREYRELARNDLKDQLRSSLVFDGKRVYVRTAKHLYCIGE